MDRGHNREPIFADDENENENGDSSPNFFSFAGRSAGVPGSTRSLWSGYGMSTLKIARQGWN
jgi:hypothetical protein